MIDYISKVKNILIIDVFWLAKPIIKIMVNIVFNVINILIVDQTIEPEMLQIFSNGGFHSHSGVFILAIIGGFLWDIPMSIVCWHHSSSSFASSLLQGSSASLFAPRYSYISCFLIWRSSFSLKFSRHCIISVVS